MSQQKNLKLHNVRVQNITKLASPAEYWIQYPSTPEIENQVAGQRIAIERIIDGDDQRMLMIVGPCSIHDPEACLEYARRLKFLADDVSDRILIAMRVYFEKPRTTVGWKGYINDPNLNDTYDVETGMAKAREFLLEVCKIGLPAATEFLEPFTPQYLGDLVSWGAIGARTTESQTHRLIASGLSMPIGFKNGTGGTVQIAVDAMIASSSDHVFLGIDDDGVASIVTTTGNPATHLVLRGGSSGPNYDRDSVTAAQTMLRNASLKPNLVVDCSHANSGKDHKKQPAVFKNILQQRTSGNIGIIGLMLESHLNEGTQTLTEDPSKLKYGLSITDACINWNETDDLVRYAYSQLAS